MANGEAILTLDGEVVVAATTVCPACGRANRNTEDYETARRESNGWPIIGLCSGCGLLYAIDRETLKVRHLSRHERSHITQHPKAAEIKRCHDEVVRGLQG